MVLSLPKRTNDLGLGEATKFPPGRVCAKGGQFLPADSRMSMGTTSECKSVTNSTRNLLSPEEKGSELKGRKQAGRSASGDKKSENSETSKLTYTSEEDVYYEPGGE